MAHNIQYILEPYKQLGTKPNAVDQKQDPYIEWTIYTGIARGKGETKDQ